LVSAVSWFEPRKRKVSLNSPASFDRSPSQFESFFSSLRRTTSFDCRCVASKAHFFPLFNFFPTNPTPVFSEKKFCLHSLFSPFPNFFFFFLREDCRPHSFFTFLTFFIVFLFFPSRVLLCRQFPLSPQPVFPIPLPHDLTPLLSYFFASFPFFSWQNLSLTPP